jgi:DNA-binding response OmpR family regulator
MESEGHLVDEAVDAAGVLERCRTSAWDLLILDSGADGSGGCALCRRIRKSSAVGILVLFRDGSGQSRIDSLNAGADDYLSQGFVPAELHARVRAILRRVRNTDETLRHVLLKDRAIDLDSRKVEGPGNRSTRLTPKEYLVLKYLMTRPDIPVNHRELARTVWQRDGSGDLEYVRIVIGQLRRKIEPDYSAPRYILTERLVGYRFAAAADRSDSPAMAR